MVSLALLVACLWMEAAAADDSPSHMLWFPTQAINYKSSLPLGNGRLGVTIGGYPDEWIIMNEDSVWSGRKQDRINRNAPGALARIRQKLDAGNIDAAEADFASNLAGDPSRPRKFEPAGNLNVVTGHDGLSNVNRTLDLQTGFYSHSYTSKGVRYTREAVASAPANVFAMQFTADSPGQIAFALYMSRDKGVDSVVTNSEQTHCITMNAYGSDDPGYQFTSRACLTTQGGNVTTDAIKGNALHVSGADSVVLWWDAETAFYSPQWEQVLTDRLTAAMESTFDIIAKAAVADHQKYYDRVSFNVGATAPAARYNTMDRIGNIQKTRDLNSDPELLALMWNYGRYLLICSSRPGSLPPNLQGVWNDHMDPPWGSMYTVNINLQMNYWAANTAGLGDLMQPLWDLLKTAATSGVDCAQRMYNATGWVVHHNLDHWGDCAPADGSGPWAPWTLAGAWLLSHASEHYRFTRNATFAKLVALPLMSSALDFYTSFAVVSQGQIKVYPSTSPENQYAMDAGGNLVGMDITPTSDRALLWDLATSFIELSEAVGTTEGVTRAQAFLAQIPPPAVNPSNGRLLEWSKDFPEAEAGHRHFSPLYGMHPGHEYSPLKNPNLFKAAQLLHQHRTESGSGSTGWSRMWSACLHARSFLGDAVVEDFVEMIATYTLSNLWAITSDVFQIDANFGLVEAVNEVFLQSHLDGLVHLGPALPTKALASGSFTGWRARGGFQVDATWENSHIKTATIVASVDGPLSIRVENGLKFNVNGNPYAAPIQAKKGQKYTITPL
ncbi:Six-hairpin glycosidase-like protein [Colletotrichum navitas]|uniref:Six-hairpin glycosidase-like protein n=1 Tax=Colletotrichum navitas TaxID=681940 RepID=A0AAD8PL21_9PEZI|nr:Six-hairpin glycosidase-like protein [Colletotrichum navitas]KAK1569362.1 Six-hairpin glycosidase-like protein [Colletotrichum navitas]